MSRLGTANRSSSGAVLFLSHIPAGLSLPAMPGALCKAEGHDPDLWHPENGDRAAAEYAKAVCQRCPARSRCLRWAMEANEEHGVWGGTTAPERTALRRASRRSGGQASATKAEVAA
jgi:WhiB family transcriptional regulator, redox-sensing transcriptional regulator